MPTNIGAAYRAGVPIAFGTDAGITPHGMQALEFLWYRKIGMTPGALRQPALDPRLCGGTRFFHNRTTESWILTIPG